MIKRTRSARIVHWRWRYTCNPAFACAKIAAAGRLPAPWRPDPLRRLSTELASNPCTPGGVSKSVNFSIDDQCGDRRISSSGLCGGASLCGVTLMTSRGCMRCPVSLSRKPRMTLPDLSMMTPSALTTVTTSTFTVAADARPFLAAIRELTGRALRRAVFLKVPCDRPTFAATRGYCIPPRGPWRACVRNQRARARGMRRLGRDGRVIRRFVALS